MNIMNMLMKLHFSFIFSLSHFRFTFSGRSFLIILKTNLTSDRAGDHNTFSAEMCYFLAEAS